MFQKEVWKDIKNYEGIYQVSNFGRIKSLKFGKDRILKAGINSRGYYYIVLYKNKTIKNRTVHQLVAESFLNHKPCGMGMVVDHINCDKLDNRDENLRIISQRDNSNLRHIKSTSQYVGVCWAKNRNKWLAQIQINGTVKKLGYFTNELAASNAYQEALKFLNN